MYDEGYEEQQARVDGVGVGHRNFTGRLPQPLASRSARSPSFSLST